MSIKDKSGVFHFFSADSEEQASRHLYKWTTCGAWIEFEEDGVELASIVEGCDFGTFRYFLKYPFSNSDLNARIMAIEEEAKLLWNWANETDQENDPPYYEPPFESNGRSA